MTVLVENSLESNIVSDLGRQRENPENIEFLKTMMVGRTLIILLLVLLMVDIHSSMSDTHARGDANCKTRVYSFNPPGLWGIDPPRPRGINPSGLVGRVVWE